MSKSAQAGDFFVVGGPVQSDRACYVKRAADEKLARAIAEERFAYVLGPRATGKSSLMARTIRRLRAEGQLAAVVDLTQIGSRSEGTDAGRWYYSIAYRIVRELRLKVDLQAWWQDRSALLAEQRLVEFFGDIVLANTTAPVNVFIDEADRAIELPFAHELFIALRSCYMRRVSEPDFTRLNFVVLGVATPELLCPDASLSPFTDGVGIDLADFSADEVQQLAAGFSCDEQTAHEIVRAIHGWTGGHPYLTQKVARAVARRSGGVGDVEPTVRELFLAPSRLHEEPLLSHMRAELEGGDKVTRQALQLLSRLADGAAPAGEGGAAGRALLDRIGMLGRAADGSLRYRNPVFRQLFDAEFSKSSTPVDWRRPALVAVAALLVVALPYWYLRVLPQPYIATLTVVSQDVALAEEAYNRLRRLPGFGARAERLLADAMVRRSEQSAALDDVMAADRVLRQLPAQTELADQMLAAYWLRRAADSMHGGDRDGALLYALAAGQGSPEASNALAAELIDGDYPHLEASFRSSEVPADWAIDWARDQIVLIDASRRIRHFALGTRTDGSRPPPRASLPGRLTAVQHVDVQRELTVDADGSAGAFALTLTMQHARASDLHVRLTSPAGASVEFSVPQPRADQQSLIFNARRGSPLADLSNESIRGQWQLTLTDRRSGEQGVLTRWSMQFQGAAGVSWDDEPEQGVPIPDPVRTEQADATLAQRGGAVVTVPARAGATGAMSVWDLARGELRADIGIETPPQLVRLLGDGARLITVDQARAALWDVDAGQVIAELDAEAAFVMPPAVSPDERFVVFALADGEASSVVTLIDTGNGDRVGSFALRGPLAEWVLAAGGRYLAVVDESRWLRFFDAASGEPLGELMHQRRLRRLAPLTRADLIVAVDSDNAVFAWPVDVDTDGLHIGEAQFLGVTGDPASVAVADRARRVVFSGIGDRIQVRDVGVGGLRGTGLRMDAPRRVRLSEDGQDVIVEGDRLLRRWRVRDDALQPLPALAVSAAAIDPTASVAALGYRAGHVQLHQLGNVGSSAAGRSGVDYIGHRGAVTSLDVAPDSGIAASGGADGVVRVWDIASVAPNEFFLRHPEGPVTVVRISPDGSMIASGAEYSARLWHARSGELIAEVPVDGSVTALAFGPGSDLIAVGDSAGNLFLGSPRGGDALRSARLATAVTAVAFSADAALLAAADAGGSLGIWNAGATDVALARTSLSEPVRWISFDETPGGLVVGTDEWLHAVDFTPGSIAISATRLRGTGISAVAAIARTGPATVRIAGASAAGGAESRDVPLRRAAATALPPASRNWGAILGLALDAATGRVYPAVD